MPRAAATLLCASFLAGCAASSSRTTRTETDDVALARMLAPTAVEPRMTGALASVLQAKGEASRLDLPVGRTLRRCEVRREGDVVRISCDRLQARFPRMDDALRALNDGSVARDLVTLDLADPELVAPSLDGCGEAPLCRLGNDGLTMILRAAPFGTVEGSVFSPEGPAHTLVGDSLPELRDALAIRIDSLHAEAEEARARTTLHRSVEELLVPLIGAPTLRFGDAWPGMKESEHPGGGASVFTPSPEAAGVVYPERLRYLISPIPITDSSSRDRSLLSLDGEIVEIAAVRGHGGDLPSDPTAVVAESIALRFRQPPVITRMGERAGEVSLVIGAATLIVRVRPGTVELALRSAAYAQVPLLRARADEEAARTQRERVCAECRRVRIGQKVMRYFTVRSVDRAGCTMTIVTSDGGTSRRTRNRGPSVVPCNSENR